MAGHPSRTVRSGDRRLALLLGLLVALLLLPFHRGAFQSTDEIGLFEITRSLAERGDRNVPRQRHVFRGREGRLFHQYAVGQAVLALPFYGLGDALGRLPPGVSAAFDVPDSRLPDGRRVRGGPEMFAVGLLPFAAVGALVGVFFLFERRLGVSRGPAAAVALLLGTCTHAALMATFYMRHATTALAVLGALLALHVWRTEGSLRALATASALAASLVLVRVPDGLALVVLGPVLLWTLHARRVWRLPVGARARVAAAVAGPPALAAAVHLGLNVYRWERWMGSPIIEAGHFHTPLWISGYANLASPGASILLYSPLLLLVLWSFGTLWRRHRPEAAAALALSASFWVVFSWYDGWPGQWTMPGPRYLFVAVPLLLLSLGPWLEATPGRGKWVAVGALAALGLGVQVVFLVTSWAELVLASGWKTFEPTWGFLFLPDASPLAQALRGLRQGALLDPWLVELARGGPGRLPRPGAAAALLAMWAAASALTLRALVRALRGGRALTPPVPRRAALPPAPARPASRTRRGG